ncbi:MAG: hypothetical protein JWN01_738 [Patescibacteria group bacterium]|nr:hypothetical protein [Patescibacteria group bacterium]
MHIDLSVRLTNQTPVYPGDPAVRVKPVTNIEQDGFQDHLVTLATHVGTHIDAPSHMISGGHNLDAYPVERFVGRGVYIDVRQGYNLADIRKLGLKAGDIVIFHTGMIERYEKTDYFEKFTPIPAEVAHYLVERQVSLVGMDMCGPDYPPFPIHKILLGGDVLIIENLTNLDRLAGRTFTITALPLRLDVDAAPARVIATIL